MKKDGHHLDLFNSTNKSGCTVAEEWIYMTVALTNEQQYRQHARRGVELYNTKILLWMRVDHHPTGYAICVLDRRIYMYITVLSI